MFHLTMINNNAIAELIDKHVNFLKTGSLVLGVFAIVLFALGFWITRGKKKTGEYVIFFGFIMLASSSTISQIMFTFEADLAKNEIRTTRNHVKEAYLDGARCEYPVSIARDVSAPYDVRHPYHSHAGPPHNVTLYSKETSILVVIAQDSRDPQNWWIFYPKFKLTGYSTLGPSIGRANFDPQIDCHGSDSHSNID